VVYQRSFTSALHVRCCCRWSSGARLDERIYLDAHLVRDRMHVQRHAALQVRGAQPLARAVRGVLARVTGTFAVTRTHGERPAVLVCQVHASHRLPHAALDLRVLACARQPPRVVAGFLRAPARHHTPTSPHRQMTRQFACPVVGRAELTAKGEPWKRNDECCQFALQLSSY